MSARTMTTLAIVSLCLAANAGCSDDDEVAGGGAPTTGTGGAGGLAGSGGTGGSGAEGAAGGAGGLEPYDRLDPPYPRIGLLSWSGAPAEWYAKFDLAMICKIGNTVPNAVHAHNPNTIMVSVVEDWNVLDPRWGGNYSNQWRVLDSQGQPLIIYGGVGPLGDITEHCPEVGGIQYNDQLIEVMTTKADLSVWDGVITDGVWENPYGFADVDLDRNGTNDLVEHDNSWVTHEWLEGVNKVCTGIRELIDDKLLLLNSGRFHTFEWESSNGFYMEHVGCSYSFQYYADLYDEWKETAPEPHVFLLGANRADDQGDFAFMRFHLGVALYGSGYIEVTDGDSREHHYVSYYDEYDVNLGYPTGPMQQIESLGYDGQGTWVRFFDRGAVILNVFAEPNTVTDATISALDGYDGPYHRFQGGQDPSVNDGQPFDSVTLDGRLGYDPNCLVGDAILLVKSPTVVVSDILVDNDDPDTSPGCDSAELVGSWEQLCGDGGTSDHSYDQGCRGWAEYWGLASSSAVGDYAIFRPSVGVAGTYDVYEWHGEVVGADEDTAVPVEIHHAEGMDALVVDQTQNVGQWNLLGTYDFAAGTDGYVRLEVGGGGAVVADAVKLVYRP